MNQKNNSLTDFDSQDGASGFFCMKLLSYIVDNNADYLEEMKKAKNGKCSYRDICPIYKRTIARHGAVQMRIEY